MLHMLQVEGLHIAVVRKQVRGLRLSVRRADGRLRVSAPWHTPEATIRELVAQKLPWIQKHQAAFLAQAPLPTLQYVAGEMHYYQGIAYPLEVMERPGRTQVVLADGRLCLGIPAGSTPAQRQLALAGWRRAQLQAQLPALLAKWEPVVGAHAQSWGIKQMKTRWGTCSLRPRRIWLSLELSQWPLACLEYVVVHELTHLHERLHNARFWHLLGQALPTWQQPHQLLKHGSLAAAGAALA